ncbi:peptidoglycan recognition protein family protein [Streptococcus uberis]|uniref:peptidoglycan recognition family protein n=1 Tax=Streptococcus uberis TaxID=1349 RepID=UPI0027DC9ABB|nr:peptidoglycan recognition family protein [Streptococcus uberis]MCK1238276.1 peptidoglycan recognition protein family protein [Streptococcus uberis]
MSPSQLVMKHYKKLLNQKNLIILLIVLILALLFHYTFYVTPLTKYQSTQEAKIVSNETKLYPSHWLLIPKKISEKTNVTVNGYQLGQFRGQKMLFAKITYQGNSYLVESKRLDIELSNPVNAYLQSLDFPKVQIKNKLIKTFPKTPYFGSQGKPKGIIIHDTGTEQSSIADEIYYMVKNYKKEGIFVHTFIDDQEILNIADNHFMAQGAGPKANPYFVQFEMPHVYSQEAFAKQLANAAYYTAKTLKENNLPLTLGQANGEGTLWTHEMISLYLGGTDHIDPTDYWSQSAYLFFWDNVFHF